MKLVIYKNCGSLLHNECNQQVRAMIEKLSDTFAAFG
jgi:hypothetical protein